MRSRYGRYEVLSKLGQGAMAQVFLARDPVLSRLVAVKVLHADLAERKDVLQRFFNEARTVAVVRNPHVVEVFDFGQEGNDLFLVMEFVDGVSLQGMLRRRPAGHAETFAPLEATLAAALMCQAAEGLSIAARHGVVHRDIKPENLMINRQGYLKISDFGIAHIQDDSITKTGAVLGSPLFMSPEQARGVKPITSQADMFSLGSVFYFCLSGRPPFRGRNIADLIRKIASEPHPPLWKLRPEVDPSLASLVETLLRKDPSQRGGGPRWLHRQLKEYLAGHGAADPAELIAGHVRSGAGPEAQSTWRMDAPDSGPPTAASATESCTRNKAPRKRVRLSGWALAGLSFTAAGLIIGLAATVGLGGISDTLVGQSGHTQSKDVGAPGGQAAGDEPGKGFPAPLNQGFGRVQLLSFDSEAGGMEGRLGNYAARPVPEPEGAFPTSGEFREAQDSPPSEESFPVHIAGPAVLSLRSSPPFADVFVDGRYMGVTPLRVELAVAGNHRLVLRVKDVPDLDTILSLASGTHELKLRLAFDAMARMEGEPDSGE